MSVVMKGPCALFGVRLLSTCELHLGLHRIIVRNRSLLSFRSFYKPNKQIRVTANFPFFAFFYNQHFTKSSAIVQWPRDAPGQLKSCQLSRNSAETTCTTSPEQIEVMKLKCYSKAMCNKHVHSTITRSSRFHCPVGVINKPTTVDITRISLWISPVYRRLTVAKFSKSTI